MAARTAAEAAYEAALSEIEWVRVEGGATLDLSGEAFAALARIPPEVAGIAGLVALDLNGTKVSDLSPLRGLTALHSLSLNLSAVSDLSPLRDLTALQSLTLTQTVVSDLSPLRDLTALQSLKLNQTAVSDLSPLRGLTALHSLSLNLSAVSDLSPLRDLTALQSLTLTQTVVSDLSPLRDLTALQSLKLDETAVSDLSPLRDLTALQSLTLTQTAVSDLSPLRDLTALQDLWLTQAAVSDLRPLAALPFHASVTSHGLWFMDTPATLHDPDLHRLSQMDDNEQRTHQTLAYLKTLPPWPEPLPWQTEGLGLPARSEPYRQSESFPPAIHLPAGLRRITLAEARHILVSDRPLLRARCQHVVAELDDALAMQAVRIPNEPDQLAAHTAITNSLTLAKAALMGLHDALPEDDLDRPVTEAEVTALRTAIDALLDKLKSAAAYVDRTDHTPTYGGLLKLGCATGIASVLCLFPGLAMTAAIPGVYAMLYGGPAAIKTLGELGKKAGGA